MKKIHLFLVGLMGFLMTSCESSVTGEGSPDLAQDFIVQDFSAIEAEGLFKVLLIESDSTYISVQTHQNLIENMSISNSGNTLKIGEKNPVEAFESYEVYVYYSQPIENIRLKKKVLLQAGGVFRTETLNFDLRDNAQVDEFNVSAKEVAVNATGKTEIKLSGETIALEVNTKDMAKASLERLQARTLRVDLANESTVQVEVENEMKGRILNNAKLEYRGNPKKDVDVKDRGTITQI